MCYGFPRTATKAIMSSMLAAHWLMPLYSSKIRLSFDKCFPQNFMAPDIFQRLDYFLMEILGMVLSLYDRIICDDTGNFAGNWLQFRDSHWF